MINIPIDIPTKCPSCGHELSLVNDQLFCTNKTCEAQSLKKLEHFCKSMKIKGMGPATLEKLDLESIVDLYTFSDGYFTDRLGDTIGKKIFSEIQKSKLQPLESIIAGLSIPLIGETASKKLISVITDIKDISLDSCKKAGLGDKATNNLLSFINSDDYIDLVSLPLTFNTKVITSNKNGVSVCITGKLLEFKTRTQAATYLESLGYTVTDSVTKKTNYLIDEEGKTSSKRTKAESLGIEILTIQELLQRKN